MKKFPIRVRVANGRMISILHGADAAGLRVGLTAFLREALVVPKMAVLGLHPDELAQLVEIVANRLPSESVGIALMQIEDQFKAVIVAHTAL